MANPYSSFLADLNAREIIATTPGRLRDVAGKLGAAGLEQAIAPGKWTAREILCHLADCELAFGFRLRQAAAEEHHVIQPFDQDGWARVNRSCSAQQALRAFSAVREWNLAFVSGLDPATLQKPLSHPERGPMVLLTIIETMGGHDLNHLTQLETIAARSLR